MEPREGSEREYFWLRRNGPENDRRKKRPWRTGVRGPVKSNEVGTNIGSKIEKMFRTIKQVKLNVASNPESLWDTQGCRIWGVVSVCT